MHNPLAPREAGSHTIAVLFGQPGAGKNYIGDLINKRIPGYTCFDGDNYVTEEGHKKHQNGTWNDNDRKEFIRAMAADLTEKSKNTRVVIATAMTTRWMREYFDKAVQTLGDYNLAWVWVVRNLSEKDIQQLVEERASMGHILGDRNTFNRFSNAFETPLPPYLKLHNPGPQAGESALLVATCKVLTEIYGN